MGHIEKRSITLSPEQASLVDEVVAAGEFASPSEVVGEALREWQERRDNHGYTLAELRRLWDEGLKSGEPRPGPPIMERLIAKYAAMAAGSDAAE